MTTALRCRLVPVHKWTYQARFRANAFGWKASNLACQRLKESVAEIRKVAKSDPLLAAEGVVLLAIVSAGPAEAAVLAFRLERPLITAYDPSGLHY